MLSEPPHVSWVRGLSAGLPQRSHAPDSHWAQGLSRPPLAVALSPPLQPSAVCPVGPVPSSGVGI